MHILGRKRQGRFIKKDSRILERIALDSFSFDDVSDQPTILPDNSKRSIIHSPYHESTEIQDAVKSFQQLEKDLQEDGQRRSVLAPLDFSNDWARMRRFSKGHDLHLDEDEDFYNPKVGQRNSSRASKNDDHSNKSIGENETPSQIDKNGMDLSTHESTILETKSPFILKRDERHSSAQSQEIPKQIFPSKVESTGLDWNSIEVAGNAIKSIQRTQSDISSDQSKEDSIIEEPLTNQQSSSRHVDSSIDQFISDPELTFSAKYPPRIVETSAFTERDLRQIEEEKAKGYRDGFKIGEEKAEFQIRENSKELFIKMEKLVSDFNSLQSSLLNSVQENFLIVCQALAEALLKREFSLHPETFQEVVRRAIDEGIEPGKVKIKVHPDTFDRLMSLGDSEFIGSLVKDTQVSPGDFKLESEMSIVDVNIGKLVAQLLSQADLNIFDSMEKAG